MDAQTNVIRWRGEMLSLSSEQRQTLRILLQHAGQILSGERLASLLHVAAEKVDTHVYSLRTALEAGRILGATTRGRLRLYTLALTPAKRLSSDVFGNWFIAFAG